MALNVAASIPDGATILVDSAPVIYVLEGGRLARRFEPVFADVAAGRIHALVTPITIAEVAAGPLAAGKPTLAERYRKAVTASPGWFVREIDDEAAMLAARLRAEHRLRLPDAFQLACAILENCHALLTHDRDFSAVTELPILGL
jgi:predicted nucleic acid-binding protein